MKAKLTTAVLLIIGFTACTPAYAQLRWFNPGNIGFSAAMGGWPGPIQGVASGPGDYLSGMSQVIRSQGEYNETTSRAMINYEEARSRYLENRKQWTATYFAMREENESRRAERIRRATYSQEVLIAAAHSGVPRPLSRESFDPVTGMLTWPDVLQDDLFREQRERIDRLMELRALTSRGRNPAHEIYAASEEMILLLKARIHELPAEEYIAARRFLDSLSYMVRSTT